MTDSPPPTTLPPRPLALGVSALGLAMGVGRWVQQRSLGFPDGHLTELERALRGPHLGLAVAGVTVSLVLLWPGRRWGWVVLALVLWIVDWVGLELLGRVMGLEDGGGG